MSSVQPAGVQAPTQTGQSTGPAPNPQPAPPPIPPSGDTISSGQTNPFDGLYHFATEAMATVSRAGSAASEAAPIIEAGAVRVLGVFGALLSLSGDTPQNAGVFEQRQLYPDATLTAAGSHAMADFNQCHPDDKNNLDGGGLREFSGRSDIAFNALKQSLGSLPIDANGKPYQVHHLVEQNQTSRFGTQAIQNTANAVAVPESTHQKISGFYSSKAANLGFKNPDGSPAGGTVRDYVGKMSYTEQRQFGINTTRGAVKDDVSLSSADKAKISKQLDTLERLQPDNCAEVK